MHEFAYIDETFDLNLTQSYKLSIQVNLNGLSFCILDPVQNKFIALVGFKFKYDEFNNYLNKLEKLLSKDELLKLNYKQVQLLWLSPKNTIVPNKFFEQDHIKNHFEFIHKMDELDELHFNDILLIDSKSIFAIPNQVATIFSRKYPKIKFYNQQSPFIEHILKKYHSTHKKVFLNINQQFIDIAITVNEKLILYNNFHYKSDMDIIYFAMNIYNQYKNQTGNTEVFASGLIDKKSEIFKNLIKFIPQLKFDKPTTEYAYSYTFNKLPHHQFINLFNLINCE